jgi:hypothetical protein
LLPYKPELNPIEQIWEGIREKNFKNELFKTLAYVVDRICVGLLTLEFNKNKVTIQSPTLNEVLTDFNCHHLFTLKLAY